MRARQLLLLLSVILRLISLGRKLVKSWLLLLLLNSRVHSNSSGASVELRWPLLLHLLALTNSRIRSVEAIRVRTTSLAVVAEEDRATHLRHLVGRGAAELIHELWRRAHGTAPVAAVLDVAHLLYHRATGAATRDRAAGVVVDDVVPGDDLAAGGPHEETEAAWPEHV